MADPRLDGHPRPRVRGRGEKKADRTGGQEDQDLGRSRGGFGTKIHAVVSGLGLPVRLTLSPGQDADITHADELLDGFTPAVVIGDKGYDKQALVDAIEAGGAEAVIPTLKTRKVQRDIDRDRYKDRNLVERFWANIKHYRRVATRYEKTAQNFLAFVHLASLMVLLR